MTLFELYSATAQLGFESSLDDDGGTIRFIQATNRSIVQVNSLRPRKNTFVLNHIDPTQFIAASLDKVERVTDVSLEADGVKGIYFETCGKGECVVGLECVKTNADGEKEFELLPIAFGASSAYEFESRGFVPHKVLVKYTDRFVDELKGESAGVYGTFTGKVVIRFGGNYAYSIRNIAMYHTITSGNTVDIMPFKPQLQYDMRSLVDDFDRFATPPLVHKEDRIVSESNYTVLGGHTLLLPIAYPGVYSIEYLTKPVLFDMDTAVGNQPIQLDEDLCQLLPLLVASYIWLDDEPEKAQYYYNLYIQRSTEVSYATKGDSRLPFVSVYEGW